MTGKSHLDTNRCWLPYFWSTVIVILLQNVFIAASLLPLLVPMALGLCANYQHCSTARIVDTCTRVRRKGGPSKWALMKVVEEVEGNDLGQYHQQEVSAAGEKRQIREEEENQKVFWTVRQFHISPSSPGPEEEGRVIIFPMNEPLFKSHPWQRKRKRRIRRAGTEKEGTGQVEVIVAKKKRKLLDFPVAFYKSSSSSSSERPVKRISGLIVDKQSFNGSHRGNRKSSSCNITINGMCCGFNSLPRHPSVDVEDVVVAVGSNVDRITGQSANSSSRLVAHWSFLQRHRQQNQSCTSNTIRTCDGGGVRPTQSIGTFHQPHSGRTVAIDFSAYQELNCIECEYSNYCNYKAVLWTVKRSLCVLALQKGIINSNNTRNQLSSPVFDEEEQLISKGLSTDIWILHLVVKLIAVAVIFQLRRRKSESSDVAMPEMSLTITVQGTSTIRVIIHGQKQHHPQQQHHSQLQHQLEEEEEALTGEKLSVYLQDVIVVVVSGDTCCGNAFELHWCLRLSCASSAISPFPLQTGTCSSVDLKCPTSLTMMMLVTDIDVPNPPFLTRGTEKGAFKVEEECEKLKGKSNSQTEWATNRQRGGEARKEKKRPSPKTNGSMSKADGMEIKLKHYNSSKDIKGRVCETEWVLPCPRATSTDKRRHLVLLLTVAIIFVVNLPSVSCIAAPGPQGPSPVGGGIGSFKYSTNVVKTKYGPLRGIVLRSHPVVEAYLGVPYATPPVGSLR